jgi:predicted nucleic-acid-binding Zn-ribbon protein
MSVRKKRSAMRSCKKCGYDRVRRTDRIDLGDHGFLIQCPKCRNKSKVGFTVDDAVLFWNYENLAEEGEANA